MDNLARLPPDGIWVYPLRKLRGLCVCGNRSSVHRSQVALDRRLFGVSLNLRLRLGLMDKQLSQLGQCRLPIVGADGIQAFVLDERQDRFLVAFPIPAFFLLLLVSQGLQLSYPAPCDHVPIRSWPLYRARAVMGSVVEAIKVEQRA